MDKLAYELHKLCDRNRDGGYNTQGDRRGTLIMISRQLVEMGFRHMGAKSLKYKHVLALVTRWLREGLSAGTIKNRIAYVRWWAEKVGKASEIPKDNAWFGIPERQFVTNEDKSRGLGAGIDAITGPHVRLSLEMQQAFGLRRGESIKFQPRYADQGHFILIMNSWAKGGRTRTVPITTEAQRTVLNRAHALAGSGSLIPAHLTYIQQRNIYDAQCKAAGLSRMHGLRHAYAQTRYEVLTGWKAPAAGGPSARMLSQEQRRVDRQARQIISRELGHERISVTAVYLGR
jgi:integrase